MTKNTIFIMTILVLMSQTASAATVQHFNNKDAWRAVVGEYDTIDFTGLPNNTLLNKQYASYGVTFAEWTYIEQHTSYLNDGWGMVGYDGAWLHFDEPIQWLAAEHSGAVQYRFYRDGQLIATSGLMGGSGLGKFSGVILDKTFDTVYIFKPWPFDPNWVFVDDIHFGPPVPAPGALGVFALAALGCRRRRRC